jgi:hypothetical protein
LIVAVIYIPLGHGGAFPVILNHGWKKGLSLQMRGEHYVDSLLRREKYLRALQNQKPLGVDGSCPNLGLLHDLVSRQCEFDQIWIEREGKEISRLGHDQGRVRCPGQSESKSILSGRLMPDFLGGGRICG